MLRPPSSTLSRPAPALMFCCLRILTTFSDQGPGAFILPRALEALWSHPPPPQPDREGHGRTDLVRRLTASDSRLLGRLAAPISFLCLLCVNGLRSRISWFLAFDPFSALQACVPRFPVVLPALCFTPWLVGLSALFAQIPAWLPDPRVPAHPCLGLPRLCPLSPQGLPGHGLEPSCPVTVVCSLHLGFRAGKLAAELCKQDLDASLCGQLCE